MHETLATWAIAQFFASSSVKPTQGTSLERKKWKKKRSQEIILPEFALRVKFVSSCLSQALTASLWHRGRWILNLKRIVVRTRYNLNGTLFERWNRVQRTAELRNTKSGSSDDDEERKIEVISNELIRDFLYHLIAFELMMNLNKFPSLFVYLSKPLSLHK